MCVVSTAWQAHPDWLLVAAGNRDELHARPSAKVARWDDHPSILAGRDLVSGGTWMGVSDDQRFVVVTNVSGFGLPDPDRASRGVLVSGLLSGHASRIRPDHAALAACNPLNLIVIDRTSASLSTNTPVPCTVALSPGIHGLSNGQLDAHWPRREDLDQRLSDWLSSGSPNPRDLFSALNDEQSHDGNPPIKIRNDIYGTRCSTIVAIDAAGNGLIAERSFNRDGSISGEVDYSFTWDIA
jgi:uncharacterized protein with NRDE domain